MDGSETPPTRVVITNVVALNAGDAAILLGIIKVLRRAFENLDLVVLDSQAVISARLYPEIRFEQLGLMWNYRRVAGRIWRLLVTVLGDRRHWLPKYSSNFAAYNNADIIISTGGTYLVEHYDLTDRMHQFRFIVAAKKRIVMYTQSLGPFTKREIVAWMRQLMPQVDLVLLRDERSAGNLRQIGAIAKKSQVIADAAFALAEPQHLRAAAAWAGKPGLRVAISVREWKHFRSGEATETLNAYYSGVAATVEKLVRERGAEVTFISTCQGVPEYWTDDSKAASQIISLIDPKVRKRVTLDAGFHRPEALIALLSGFDLAIATRMHFAILSLCAAIPVFPIAYEFKTSELFANLGLGKWVMEIEEASEKTLPDKVSDFIDELPTIWPPLIEAVLLQHENAMAAAALVAQLKV